MKILIAGDGWGFKALYDGLKNFYGGLFICSSFAEIRDTDERVGSVEGCYDLVICAGYKSIVPREYLEQTRVINIHYSLLPKYRGLHSTVWALLNDEKKLGFSIYLMNEYIDDGDILYQYVEENDYQSTSTYYMELFNRKVAEVIGSVVGGYLAGDIEPKVQDKKEATWVGRRAHEHCKIDFNVTHGNIKNLFRALVPPYPLPYIEYDKKQYEILDYQLHYANCRTDIGRVLNIDNEGVWIKTKDGYLIVKKIRDNHHVYESNKVIRTIGAYLHR